MKSFKYSIVFLIACLITIYVVNVVECKAENVTKVGQQNILTIDNHSRSRVYEPLEAITVRSLKAGKLEVLDGVGDVYFRSDLNEEISFRIGGAIGTHILVLLNTKGKLIDRLAFTVNCSTRIMEDSGRYEELLDILYHSMTGKWETEVAVKRYRGKDYHLFVSWLRDHVHTLKGMKYYYPELKSGIDLYGDSQRSDGMIWDNYTHPYSKEEGSYWVQRFRYGDFVRIVEENNKVFTRIPVENDVEYLFIEGIYYTWKATGDNDWMIGMLDKALKAIDYSRNDPLRWSEKYGLLKRGYTIDTWDFQNDEDAAISSGEGNLVDPMVIQGGKTRFGIMYGDNTGMAASCGYLAEMLERAGRGAEADKIRKFGENIQARIDDVSWNGQYYRHHVPEDETIIRDFGVDESKQVSLSNAYSLNRAISHEKAVQIIKTYQRLREEMPASSPGEFYTIYPPFNKGYGDHNSKWNYMNAGVTSIVAGELAHGSFEHGFEKYGVNILDRILALSKRKNNYLHCTYRGQMPAEPAREFSTLDMRKIANADFFGKTIDGVMGWLNEGENDLREFPVGEQVFENIPFDVIDPGQNDRRACLGVSNQEGYSAKSQLAVNKKGKSVYLLHIANSNYYVGRVTLHYKDGTRFSDEIGAGKILNWWYPRTPEYRKQMPSMKVAWRGSNPKSDRIGVCVYGLNNPYPDKEISDIQFTCAENGTKWMILGVTLSDYPVHFVPGIISGGIPDNWGAAAVVYALVEGLAGVKDLGVAYDKALISPRWEAASVKKANASIKYEASNGYVSYQYKMFDDGINTLFTSSGEDTELRFLLPESRRVDRVLLDGRKISFEMDTIEKSHYIVFNSSGKGVHTVLITLK